MGILILPGSFSRITVTHNDAEKTKAKRKNGRSRTIVRI